MKKETKNLLYSSSIFICKSCHLACIALPDSWIKARRGESTELLPYESMSYTENKSLVLGFNAPWVFQKNYDAIVNEIKSVWNFDFPLCDACMKSTLLMGFCQISLSQALKLYSFKLNIKSNFVSFTDDIKYHIQKKHVENRSFQEASKIVAYKKPTSSNPNRVNSINLSLSLNTDNNSSLLKSNRYKQSFPFKSCTLHTVFSFSYNRHYATINGFRLGTLTPDHVPRNEVDMGLFFLCQFVIFLGKMVGINVSCIKANYYMEVLTENATFSEVHLPSPKSKQKKYELFNQCIGIFFNVCYAILSRPCINESQRRPPFPIDLMSKKIGDFSYRFNKKHPSRWTHAMRLLTINFKTVQYLALENFVNSIDSND